MRIAATSSKFAIAAALSLTFGTMEPAAAQNVINSPSITMPNTAGATSATRTRISIVTPMRRMPIVDIPGMSRAIVSDAPGTSVAKNQPDSWKDSYIPDVNGSDTPGSKYDPNGPRLAENQPDIPGMSDNPWLR